MLIEDANLLLEPGYLHTETGYFRLSNGHMHIAVLIRMPGAKGKMVNWWFGYMGDTEKYKLWHPEDHLLGEWENWSPGHYIGATHIIEEYMGGEIMKGKGYFREPSDWSGRIESHRRRKMLFYRISRTRRGRCPYK